ncbi:MAG: hypothetical protein E7671_02155 [Ruminococcaceae bacterium]|nr:hypothetical protein [Oscillospiraceae bacterium]
MSGAECNYSRLGFSETVDILCEKKSTLILCHTRPDCDAIGSALALKKLLIAAGMDAYCICDTELPHRLRFLPTEQDSLLEENIPVSFNAERVITVDTASPAQLGSLGDRFIGQIELMIDHHGRGVQYANGYILPDASATGEIIFDISREMLRRGAIAEISKDIDFCLYAAISSDTGCFKYSSVTPKTHKTAASLIESGIDTAKINHLLFDSKSMMQLKAEKLGFDNLTLHDSGRIAVITFPYALKAEHGIADEYLETLIEVARSVEGVEVAVAIRQPKDERVFRCSMRSASETDVSAICAVLGGGGHVKAAGCTIKADNIEEAKRLVLEAVKKS